MTNAVCIMCGTRSGDAALLAEKIADRIADKDAEIERLQATVNDMRTHRDERLVDKSTEVERLRHFLEASTVLQRNLDAENDRLRKQLPQHGMDG